jgi:hypothetical protein
VASRRVEQHTRADDIRVNEILGLVNAAIDMRFRREINDGITLMIGHECVHLVGIRDIGLKKFVALAVLLRYAIQIRQITGISEDIDIAEKSWFVMLQDITDKIAPNEPTAARNQNAHRSAY